MVEGDRELLAQALGNLVDNAIDFTPSAGEILLGAEERDGGVLLNRMRYGMRHSRLRPGAYF